MLAPPHKYWFAPLVVAVALTSTTSPVQANQTALRLYERGTELFEKKRYRAAIAIFKEAYRLDEAPPFIFNIARCHELMAEWAEALDGYREYLRISPRAPNRAEVEAIAAAIIKKLSATHSWVQIATDPNGAIVTDAATGRRMGRTPTHEIWLPFGKYRLSLNLDGYRPLRRSVTVSRGKGVRVKGRLVKDDADGWIKFVQAPFGAALSIDDEPVELPGPKKGFEVGPGIHRISVKLDGRSIYEGGVRVKAAETTLVPLGTMIDPRKAVVDPDLGKPGAVFWVTLGVGVAGFAVAGALYATAYDKSTEAKAYSKTPDRQRLVWEEMKNETEARLIGASVSFGLAIASTLVAAGLGVAALYEAPDEGRETVNIVLGTGGLGLSF